MSKLKKEDPLAAKPPETLQKIKWLWVHGWDYKGYVIVGVLFAAAIFLGSDLLIGRHKSSLGEEETSTKKQARLPKEEPQKNVTSFEAISTNIPLVNRETISEGKKEVELKGSGRMTSAGQRQYSARYLNADFIRKPGIENVAVMVVTEPEIVNAPLSSAIADKLTSQSVSVSSVLLKKEFVSDGLFFDVFNGSMSVLAKLDLTNYLDTLVLIRQHIDLSTNVSLGNLIAANMKLEVLTLSIPVTGRGRTRSFIARGVGYRVEDAYSQSEDRLIKQIPDNTKALLGQMSSFNP